VKIFPLRRLTIAKTAFVAMGGGCRCNKPRDKDEHDPDGVVVEMNAADTAAPPAVLARKPCVAARAGDGDQERQQREEERLFPLAEDDAAVARDEAEEVHEATRVRSRRNHAWLDAKD
jgi:hypothetical protein